MRITRLNTDIIEIEQEKADLSSIDPLIEKYRNKKGNMIPILQGIQEIFGYIPRDAFDKVSDESMLPPPLLPTLKEQPPGRVLPESVPEKVLEIPLNKRVGLDISDLNSL